jgi:hypothetical protein
MSHCYVAFTGTDKPPAATPSNSTAPTPAKTATAETADGHTAGGGGFFSCCAARHFDKV